MGAGPREKEERNLKKSRAVLRLYLKHAHPPSAPLIRINPLRLFLWTFRRNPSDVIELYNTLSPVMQLATGGSMLNFGYWDGIAGPLEAQERLCGMMAEFSELDSALVLIDAGSGLGAPAQYWISKHPALGVYCLNINQQQLAQSDFHTSGGSVTAVNATSVKLPFAKASADRIIALESAQHFRPLDAFFRECRRVLLPGGILTIAIPVTTNTLHGTTKLLKLGILSLTWSSEHYSADEVRQALRAGGFKIAEERMIGHKVYEPLAEYYLSNRKTVRTRILQQYPSFLEVILHRSILKMRKASHKGLIDYLIIKAL